MTWRRRHTHTRSPAEPLCRSSFASVAVFSNSSSGGGAVAKLQQLGVDLEKLRRIAHSSRVCLPRVRCVALRCVEVSGRARAMFVCARANINRDECRLDRACRRRRARPLASPTIASDGCISSGRSGSSSSALDARTTLRGRRARVYAKSRARAN